MKLLFWLALGASSLLASVAGAAEPKGTTGAPPGKPDWYGVWERVGSINWDPSVRQGQPDRPPLTPEYQARYQRALDMAAAGKPINDPHANCVLLGFPRMMNMAIPSSSPSRGR